MNNKYKKVIYNIKLMFIKKDVTLEVGILNKITEGYWCVFCQRYIEADEHGIIVHDDVDHDYADFNEEMSPQ